MGRRHSEDHTRYQRILESTRDSDGVRHRDEAIKILGEELAEDRQRNEEYARARASQVADAFDRSHQPETDNGQMALDIDTYLVLGDSERVSIVDAKPAHTRQWLDVQNINKARQDMAHSAKTIHGYKLLAIQDERNCSMWEAEQIFRGDAI